MTGSATDDAGAYVDFAVAPDRALDLLGPFPAAAAAKAPVSPADV